MSNVEKFSSLIDVTSPPIFLVDVVAFGWRRIPVGVSVPTSTYIYTSKVEEQSVFFMLLRSGQGHLRFEDGTVQPISAGQALIVSERVAYTFVVDDSEAWHEQWLSISGGNTAALVAHTALDQGRAIIRFSNNGDIDGICDRVYRRSERHTNSLSTAALVLHLALSLLDIHSGVSMTLATPSFRIRRAMQALRDDCHKPLNIASLSASVGMSKSYFGQLFKKETGVSPRSFHLNARLERAKEQLRASEQSLTDIAKGLGFSSVFHFSSAFKSWSGVRPSAWRRQR